MSTLQTSVLTTPSTRQEDLDLHIRIRAEFAEMPGLRLTLPQASRLFNVEPARCEHILGGLVRSGELSSDGNAFACAGSGRAWC